MSADDAQEKEIIPIPVGQPDGDVESVFISQREYNHLVSKATRMEWWAAGVVLVCFLAFVGFMVDAYRFHSETLVDYRTTLSDIREARLTDMETALDDLTARLDTLAE